MIYKPIKTLQYVKKEIELLGDKAYDEFDLEGQICYGIYSCWWCLLKHHPGYRNGGLPCDPLGGMLLQAPAAKFIESAENNPEHYGEYGLEAFMAAYHGNVITDDGKPTALKSFKKYNDLIKAYVP